MINHNKWVNTIPFKSKELDHDKYKLDEKKWVETIPKFNDTIPKFKKDNTIKKYSFMSIIFILGIVFITGIKNETRNLQKEINNLNSSINIFRQDLHKANLDYEVISSPENISKLAKKYLDINFISYKKSQIKDIKKVYKKNDDLAFKKNKVKLKVKEKIRETKVQIQKLQNLYSNPKQVPTEIRKQIAYKIQTKKEELKNLYQNPKSVLTPEKVQKWAGIQLVKIFLGMPIVPGK